MSKSIGWAIRRRIIDVWMHNGKYHYAIILATPVVYIGSRRPVVNRVRSTCTEGHFRPWRKRR